MFDDELAEANFLGVARREMERTRVEVPLWVSHREMVEETGPLGRAGATRTYWNLTMLSHDGNPWRPDTLGDIAQLAGESNGDPPER